MSYRLSSFHFLPTLSGYWSFPQVMVLPGLPGQDSTDYNETWLLTVAIAPLIPETAHEGNEPTLVSSTFHKRHTGKRTHSPTGGCQQPLLVQEHSCTKDDVGDRGPALCLRKQKCHYVCLRWIKTLAVLRRDSIEVIPGNICPALPSPGKSFWENQAKSSPFSPFLSTSPSALHWRFSWETLAAVLSDSALRYCLNH